MEEFDNARDQYLKRFTDVLKQLLIGSQRIEQLRMMLEGVQNLVSRGDERYSEAPQFWNDLENIFERVSQDLDSQSFQLDHQ